MTTDIFQLSFPQSNTLLLKCDITEDKLTLVTQLVSHVEHDLTTPEVFYFTLAFTDSYIVISLKIILESSDLQRFHII